MNEFEKIKYEGDNYSYGYFKTHKLSNGQTVGIYFFKWELSDHLNYSVFLAIANKKKNIRQLFLEQKDMLTDKETGRCGLEGLMWGKRQLIEFENSDCCKDGDIIIIHWTDNRRRNIYEHRLKKLGYVIGVIDSKKCLYKKVYK